MSVEPEGDAKAGFCSNCRRGDHTLCASPTCTCVRHHRGQPKRPERRRGQPRDERPSTRPRDRADIFGQSRTNVLLAVLHYFTEHGYGPSMAEVADDVGLGVPTTFSHLRALRREGLLTWEDGQQRTLRPTVSVVVPAR